MTNDLALFIAVFIACIVESVEATTIVLAAGTTRDWRSAIQGVFAGVAILAIVVAIAGPAIQLLPLDALRVVVGGLLLVFGLQWMRKAILRASGYKPLHDETAIYRRQVEAANAANSTSRWVVRDWYAFTLSFKGVVLEGLEVVFIVLTFGTNQHNLPLATIGAAAAVVLVVILGVLVRGPLSRVPENTMKYVVGIMLTSFGIFWGTEGTGATWPGSDAALLVLAPAIAVFALLLTFGMRSWRLAHVTSSPATEAPTPVPASEPAASPADETLPASATSGPTVTLAPAATQQKKRLGIAGRLAAIGLFLYDFVIGDDWQVAAGVAVALVLTFVLAPVTTLAFLVVAVIAAALLPYSIRRAMA